MGGGPAPPPPPPPAATSTGGGGGGGGGGSRGGLLGQIQGFGGVGQLKNKDERSVPDLALDDHQEASLANSLAAAMKGRYVHPCLPPTPQTLA